MLGSIDPGLGVTAHVSHHDLALDSLHSLFADGGTRRILTVDDLRTGARKLRILESTVCALSHLVACTTGCSDQVILERNKTTVTGNVLTTIHLINSK